jgi:hypothetical protein
LATSGHHRRANKQSDARQADEQAPPDPLRELSERLDRASHEARRLAVEAAEAALRGGPIPPASGWAAPGDDDEDSRSRAGQVDGLVAALGSLRDVVPPELQRRLAEAVRELLVAIRALLDWYIERLHCEGQASGEVQDIPIS